MKIVLVGVDPGLVHTGVVALTLEDGELTVEPHVFTGAQKREAIACVQDYGSPHVYIEAYRSRGNIYGTDTRMRELVAEFKRSIQYARILDNTGIKNVITQNLMELFGVWQFNIPTHHQDLRSAARIALYGALKDDGLNEILFNYAFGKSGLIRG